LSKVVAQLLFVARGLLLPCTVYTANCPCGKRLIVAPSPVAILGKGFVIAFFGKRLTVALLNGCSLLGVFAIPALGVVHNVFGILNVIAFGNIYAFGNVHAIFGVLAILNLSILAPLVVLWRGTVCSHPANNNMNI
jgi:hypothetical protein